MSVRGRLFVMLVLALGATATAVATAETGHHKAHKSTQSTATKTIPKAPATQPKPPPVHSQTTPANPRPIGNLPPINDLRDRRELDAFIAARPALAPWKEEIWYVAHYSYSNVSARGLAGMIWCIAFRIPACSRAEDVRAAMLRPR